MDMKKISVAIIVIAAFMSLVVAAKESTTATTAAAPKASTPEASTTAAATPKEGEAHAPSSAGAALTTLSIVESFFSTFLVSFFAYYLQWARSGEVIN